MDPLTSIVMALALGAAAGLKPTAEQAVKDAYGSLKEFLKRKYATVNVEVLEQSPDSEPRRAVVKEDLASANADTDAELLHKVKALLDTIQSQAPDTGAAIGVDLKDIKAASLTIADVIATGTGVKAENVETGGDITITGVRAGGQGEASSKKV